jgi:hypothetical protein
VPDQKSSPELEVKNNTNPWSAESATPVFSKAKAGGVLIPSTHIDVESPPPRRVLRDRVRAFNPCR